ncbi:hypothetical protein NEDG_00500 [Nematocida displodere]|uniref:Fork-head domain-containing protein n=1 Tax=Nematocida displodere TaxID=1805483 RepID=A0A177EJ91_9MICR|nr:hypothetical protein NEDG_00500 [Nematocida displodere]
MSHSKRHRHHPLRKIKKKTTYIHLITEAIKASPEGKLTTKNICTYLSTKHSEALPASLSHVWTNCIRQVLSKNPHFVCLKRKPGARFCEWIFFPFSIAKKRQKKEAKIDFRGNWMHVLSHAGSYKKFSATASKKTENNSSSPFTYL